MRAEGRFGRPDNALCHTKSSALILEESSQIREQSENVW